MNIWHSTADAPRRPERVVAGEPVVLQIGTWPIEAGQSVAVECEIESGKSDVRRNTVGASWKRNEGFNSYWEAVIGPFGKGQRVTYRIHGRSPGGRAEVSPSTFCVAPRLDLAILWHQHQPVYRDAAHRAPQGRYLQPWVRLHAIRDYYSMAALVGRYPDVHLTINLTPSLLVQIEDYVEHGATDRALDLTLRPAETLDAAESEEILSGFFDAHWHNQIYPHPRYRELFLKRRSGETFSVGEIRDLQMWFNLAWFGKEFRDGNVRLPDGDLVSVAEHVRKGRNFSDAEIQEMVATQRGIMRSVIRVHRDLQDRGQIEISTTPFYHPILPLLINSDEATIDRPGATRPRQFAWPEDAQAQVRLAVESYTRWFGRPPRGMWPAEGAVSRSAMPLFARHGIRWVATDQSVLEKSGRYGYRVEDPRVLCRPYLSQDASPPVAMYFRDTALSDAIGFHYYRYADYRQAADDFLGQIRQRFASRVTGNEDYVLPVILDGENAWGEYFADGRTFLDALYAALATDNEIGTVTFSEFLEGNPERCVKPHSEHLEPLFDLHTGSWIDEAGSRPGVDLGTWIGEPEENRGWELLGEARQAARKAGFTPAEAPEVFESLYIAEGSDWFWWFGDDQDSGNDAEFDDLFRLHLKNAYRGMGLDPPGELDRHIVPRTVVWTFTNPVHRIQPGDRLTLRTNCPGVLTWWIDEGGESNLPLEPVGGVMGGSRRYHRTLGPFTGARRVRFRFRCTHPGCEGSDPCCWPDPVEIEIR